MSGYPYGLHVNPFFHVPVPSPEVAKALGGRSWLEARERILRCIEEVREGLGRGQKGFSNITVVGEPGTGKTHLCLHLRALANEEGFECAYVDLSKVEGRDLRSIYRGMLDDLRKTGFFEKLRQGLIQSLMEMAEKGDRRAERALLPNLLDRILRRFGGLISKKGRYVDARLASEVLEPEDPERREGVFRLLLGDVDWFYGPEELEGVLRRLKILTSFSCVYLRRPVLLEVDEVDASRPLLDGLKALINDRPPGLLLMATLLPRVDIQIGKEDPALADRLRRATFFCELSQPRDPEEMWDIIRAYLRFYGARMTGEDELMLEDFVRFLYADFGVREIRDALAIMREVFERARGAERIGEEILGEAVKTVRPTASLEDSIMRMTLYDYHRILRTRMQTSDRTSSNLAEALRSLGAFLVETRRLAYCHPTARRIETPGGAKQHRSVDVYWEDRAGRVIVLDVKITSSGYLTKQMIENVIDIANHGRVHEVVVVSNAVCPLDIPPPKLRVVKLSKRRIADFIYFSERYVARNLTPDQMSRAIELARELGIELA
ncbi:MAG: ATP-binding protein [Thermofilaceae archaeon]